MLAYKLAKPNGYDFYTGETINYRENIGKIVKCPNPNPKLGICSSGVIHASENPSDCFVGSYIPCSAYKVSGEPVCGDKEIWGFTELMILEEINDLDSLFGWKYSEAINLVNPLKLQVKPSQTDINHLKEWASVWASVGASVWASVEASVRDSVWAYIGSLFPNILHWKYISHGLGVYPYQMLVDLWKRGLIPSFDGQTWRLHSGKKADIVFEITKEKLDMSQSS